VQKYLFINNLPHNLCEKGRRNKCCYFTASTVVFIAARNCNGLYIFMFGVLQTICDSYNTRVNAYNDVRDNAHLPAVKCPIILAFPLCICAIKKNPIKENSEACQSNKCAHIQITSKGNFTEERFSFRSI